MCLLRRDPTFRSVLSATPRYTDTYSNACKLRDYITHSIITLIKMRVHLPVGYAVSFALRLLSFETWVSSLIHSRFLSLYDFFKNIPRACCRFVTNQTFRSPRLLQFLTVTTKGRNAIFKRHVEVLF